MIVHQNSPPMLLENIHDWESLGKFTSLADFWQNPAVMQGHCNKQSRADMLMTIGNVAANIWRASEIVAECKVLAPDSLRSTPPGR